MQIIHYLYYITSNYLYSVHLYSLDKVVRSKVTVTIEATVLLHVLLHADVTCIQ